MKNRVSLICRKYIFEYTDTNKGTFTLLMAPLCPDKVRTLVPVSTSHILTYLSKTLIDIKLIVATFFTKPLGNLTLKSYYTVSKTLTITSTCNIIAVGMKIQTSNVCKSIRENPQRLCSVCCP